MRKIRRKNRQLKMVVYSVVGCLLCMGIGYSVLTTSLNFQIKANKNAKEKLIDMIEKKNVSGNSDGLITDDTEDANIRYAGGGNTVKNFITFNNELWRIIGIFDGNVKIIKDTPVKNLTMSLYGESFSSGSRNYWDELNIATYLNGEYYNSLSTDAKNMTVNATYYLGHAMLYQMPSGVYTSERQDKEQGGRPGASMDRPITWNGKVGLMYLSDYGYAASSACSESLSNYSDASCKNNDWLFSGRYRESNWMMSASQIAAFDLYVLNENGKVSGSNNMSAAIRPVVYLNSAVEVKSGDGTSSNPYQLSM